MYDTSGPLHPGTVDEGDLDGLYHTSGDRFQLTDRSLAIIDIELSNGHTIQIVPRGIMGDAGEERERFVDIDPLGDQVIADLSHVPCSTSLDTASEDHRL